MKSVMHGYRIGRMIHAGSMTQTLKASSPDAGPVVIKIPAGTLPSTNAAKELRSEAKILKSFNHENVIRFIDFYDDGDCPILVMEYFPWNNLEVLRMKRRDLVTNHIRDIIIQSCKALEHVHTKEYVHRDIKPGNLLMSDTGEIKLVDFSIAKRVKRRWFSMGGRDKRTSGTLSYLAPETLTDKSWDYKTDIYSLGITIYTLLTDRLPFAASSPQELMLKHHAANPDPITAHNKLVTKRINDLVLRMMAKDPAERTSSVSEVLAAVMNTPIYNKVMKRSKCQLKY